MSSPKKKFETLCGCHVTKDGIQFCRFHGNTQTMASELDFIRGYFLKHAGGEESPFVQRIDAISASQINR
jgi:hypothetical protein